MIINSHLVEKLWNQESITDAGLSASDIDDVLLVGGSDTSCSKLLKVSGKEPHKV